MASNEEVISTLNGLIATCKDGQHGFETAAGGVGDGELKTLFRTYARQREQFAGELQDEVRRLGGDPEREGSTAAAIHRGWMGIKSAVTGEDESAVITECERGEDSAVKAYREALDRDLPVNVRTLVERQFREVREAHEHVRALERASGAGA